MMNAKEAAHIADGKLHKLLVGSEMLDCIEDIIGLKAGRGLYCTHLNLREVLNRFEIHMSEHELAACLIRYLSNYGYKCDYLKYGDKITDLTIEWGDAY